MHPVVKSLSAVAVLLALGACSSLQPQPLTAAEITTTTQADRVALQKDVLPVTAPLRLLSAVSQSKMAEAGVMLADQRRMTTPLLTPDSMSLEALTTAVGAAMTSWDQGMLPAPEAAPAAPALAPAIAADMPVDAKAIS